MNLAEFQKQVQVSRNTKTQLKSEQAYLSDKKTQFTGTILNYSSGLYVVRLEDNRTIKARSISVSGGSGIGDAVTVYFPRNGTPTLDWL